MSDSVSSPEEPRGQDKVFGKNKWRGKLFSADSRLGRALENLDRSDDNIAKFLHTAAPRPEAIPPLTPRIDGAVASRGPSAAGDEQDDKKIVDVYRRPKPRQDKGLCVRFESTPPAIIGVGGDDAELPSRDISRSLAETLTFERSSNQEQSHYNVKDRHSDTYRRSIDYHDETSFLPSSPRRRLVMVDDELPAAESHHAGHNREAAQLASVRIPNSVFRLRDEQQSLDVDSRKIDFRNASNKPSTMLEEASYDQRYNRQKAATRNPGSIRHSDVLLPEALPAKSLTPCESPESYYDAQEALLSSYYSPHDTRDLPDSGIQAIRQSPQHVSLSPENKPLSLRSVAKSLGDESLEEFDSRVRRFNHLFQLISSTHIDIMAVPFEQWVRTSAWWFLRGRGGLESAVRVKAPAIATVSAANDGDLSSNLKQAYINLAKAWWILKHVTPNHPAVRKFGNGSMHSMVPVIRGSGDKYLAELVEVNLTMLAYMHALTMSMRKHQRLPPDDIQMQRLESQIFLESPTLPPEIAALMVNNMLDPKIMGKQYVANPFFPIIIGDTPLHFSFCKIFVDVVLNYCDDAKPGVCIPCVVSVLRERTDWAVKAAVASQDGQVNLVIQSDDHGGLDWHGVQWILRQHAMQLTIAEGLVLQIKFSEKDFKTIWGICDYTQRVRKEYSASTGEEIIYERELPLVQCLDCPSFPAEPVQDCRVRLFERKSVQAKASGHQRAHDGYRLMAITSPGTKTLSKLNYHLGKDSPILFGTHRSKGRNTLLVRVPSSFSISLTFLEASDVESFRSTLSGTSIMEGDRCSTSLQLQNFTVSPVSADQNMTYMYANHCFSVLRWHKVRVVSRGPPNHGHDPQSIVGPEQLRILVDCDSCTFTDRVNVGLGDLQLNLSFQNMNTIKLLRAAQQDMTWSITDGVLEEADLSSLTDVLRSMAKSPSVRTYQFRSLLDLHNFQAMLTGFHVLYDGLASTLSISRPRMVVPLHKRWEASTPRLQIVKQEKIVQLVAFFHDFSHGACMNFVLKVTDFYDTYARSGVFFLRIVDAKFALPKGESDPAKDFVCLDMPEEYPSEHDDIIIGFGSEHGKHSKKLTGSRARNSRTN